MSCKVAIVALSGCMVSAVVGMEDALRMASFFAGGFEPEVVSPNGEAVAGFGGRCIEVAGALDRAARAQVIIIPPLLDDVVSRLEAEPELVRFLGEARPPVLVASVCTGAFFLAEAGLLDGRRATTNPAMEGAFRARYPHIALDCRQRLVDGPDVVTAGTTTAFLDLVVRLVARFAGHRVAVRTAKLLSIDVNRGSQLPYVMLQHRRAHSDAAILGLQDWLADHDLAELSVPALAKRAAMSTRSLNRRFVAATGLAPMAYVHELRVETAKQLLVESDASLAEITTRVGYQDTRSFSRLFRRLTSLTPGEYRKRFSWTS